MALAASSHAPALASARGGLRSALLASRNTDGGWGYRPGKRSRVEPTCFALLALANECGGGASCPAPVDASVLLRWERHGELLIDPGATHPNVGFNAIAALVAQYAPPTGTRLAAPLIRALMQHRGVTLPESAIIEQQNDLVGWPWVDGTFSWVEPTAWALLALKQWARTHPTVEFATRIDHGERLLRNRACREGGWNYGNPLVLGKPLGPYAATSALALLALSASARGENLGELRRDPADALTERSIKTLRQLCTTEQSGFALALSVIAFRILGQASADLERTLLALWRDSAFRGETVATAIALYAVNGQADGYEAFRV